MDFTRSNELRGEAHRLIPGGAHTYAKGDDQYPELSPGFLVSGRGCRSIDVDGNEFVEYGVGLRSVTLGHAYPPVVEAVCDAVRAGTTFVRPHVSEVETAGQLLDFLGRSEDYQVKFAKNGSDATTAAIRLARAYTGRDMVAICGDHPFFSTDDWFIGTTEMSAGIPESTRSLTVGFPYNDLAALEDVLVRHEGRIAALVMEMESGEAPGPGYLEGVAALCRSKGIVFVADEIVAGFRLANGGGQALHGVEPDLSAFGKGLGNGVPIAALVGRSELMSLGGIHTDRERVFLLSTTFGGDTIGLAAARAVMRTYEAEPVIEHLWGYGARLGEGVTRLVEAAGLSDHLGVTGRPCNLLFWTKDHRRERSQEFRALFMQEMIRHGVLGPSFVDCYSHDEAALETTLSAVAAAIEIYAKAVSAGSTRGLLIGPPTKPAIRKQA